ncbi:transglycosylase SLT domain-containing protein [Rhodococcus hoagii]|nr:transglycosylase SLT domain-containing protein [Prescottella equi]MBM4617992.1 transglycosylase SLT domain-containing protein [Prescottella equi]
MATITSLNFAIRSSWDGTALNRARDDLMALQAQMRQISGASLHFTVDADTEEAKAKIQELRAQARDIQMGIDLNDGQLATAEAKLDILARDREVDVRVNDHDIADKMDRISDSMENASVSAVNFGNSSNRAGFMGKLAMAGFAAALVVLPGLINLVGASLTGGMGAAIIAVGILALKENEQLKAGWEALWGDLKRVATESAQPMLQPLLDAMGMMRARINEMAPAFRGLFEAVAPAIKPLTGGLLDLIQNLMPGLQQALAQSGPMVAGFAEGLGKLGTRVSNMFAGMADGAVGFGRLWSVTFDQIGFMMEQFGVAAGKMSVTGTNLWDRLLTGLNQFIGGFLDGLVQFTAALDAGIGDSLSIFGLLGDVMRGVLGPLGELVAAVSNVLMPVMDGAVQAVTPVVAALMTGLTPAIQSLVPLAEALRPLMIMLGQTLADAIRQLAPLLPPIVDALVAALIPAFQALIPALVPVVQEFANGLKPILEMLPGVINTLSPIVVGLAIAFGQIVTWVAPLIPHLMQMYVAWKLINGAMAIGRGIMVAYTAVRVALTAATIAGTAATWASNIAMMANPIGLIIVAVGALAAAIVWLATKTQFFQTVWEGVKTGVAAAWNWLKGAWDATGGFLAMRWEQFTSTIVNAWNTVWGAISGAWDSTVGFLKMRWDQFTGTIANAWNTTWNAVKTAAQAVWGFLTAAWNQFLGILKAAWDIASGPLKVAWEVFWFAIRAVPAMIWAWAEVVWGHLLGFFRQSWETFVAIFKPIWDALWNGIKMAAENVWNGLKVSWEFLWNGIKAIWDWWVGVVHAVWDPFWNGIKAAAEAVWNALKGAWDWLWNQLKATLDWWTNLVHAIWDPFWNWVKQAAENVWNAIKASWDWLWNAVKGTWDWIVGVFHAVWDPFWNGLKAAAQAVWDAIKGAWDWLWNTLKTAWENFSGTLRAGWENFWNWVRDFVTGVWDAVTGKFGEFKQKVEDVFNAMVQKAEEIWDKIRGIFAKPINFVVDIWNDHVAGKFGLPELKRIEGFATGGAVNGPGTATSDSIPARLSAGEHVWTAREVDAAGGQNAVYQMRQDVLNGTFPAYANGGAVTGSISDKKVEDVKNFMRGEDGKPYQYGGVGNPSWDCSGLWSGIVNVLNGLPATAGRLFSTESDFESQGWTPGLSGRVTIGIMRGGGGPNSHMAGTVDGINMESSGDNGVRMGGPARGSDNGMFSTHFTLPEIGGDFVSGGAGGGGGGGIVRRVLSNLFKTLTNPLINAIPNPFFPGVSDPYSGFPKNAATKLRDEIYEKIRGKEDQYGGDVGGTIPDGERLNIINEALRITHTPPPSTIDSWQRGMNTLIQRESGWNSGAVNNWDSNAAAGNSSRGLAQVIPTTFNAHKVPGYDNIDAPIDNVAASINYIKDRYGSIENVQQANAAMPPKGYETGTNSAAAGWSLVGENGPEMVNFRGGEQVKTFDDIIRALKDSATGQVRDLESKVSTELRTTMDRLAQVLTDDNRNNREQVAAEIRGLVERVSADVNQSGMRFAQSVEDAIERVLAAAGMQLNLTMPVPQNAADAAAYAQEVANQLLPQLEMMIRQRIGTR